MKKFNENIGYENFLSENEENRVVNFLGALKGYEKKVKGCEYSNGKFNGYGNTHRKLKGYENCSPFYLRKTLQPDLKG